MEPSSSRQVRPENENNIKQWHAKIANAIPCPTKCYPTKPSVSSNLKQRIKFSVVAFSMTARSSPRTSARHRATSTTLAGSLRRPLNGTGVKKGQSVSINNLSKGTILAISRRGCAFLNVTFPEKEIKNPRSRVAETNGSPPLKQCMIPCLRAPPHSSCKISIVSSSAAREWIITGTSRLLASRSCLRKTAF